MTSLLLSSLLSFAPPVAGVEPESVPEQVEVAEAGEYVIVEAEPVSAFDEPAPRALEFRAGAMIMTRAEFTRTRSVEAVGASTSALPTRLRARLEARTGQLRMLAEIQDARTIADPPGAARAGFHQLYAEWSGTLPRGQLQLRAGRQQLELGNFHLFGIAPWGAVMRSWDAMRLSFVGERGSVDVFGGALARPLLSATQPLVEHVSDPVELAWVVVGDYRVFDALVLEALVWGSHIRDSADTRNLVTPGLRLHGELVPGLSYDAEGQLQVGVIERLELRQPHLAGHAFATLDYLAPRGLGAKRLRPGASLGIDYASGSKCTTTQYVDLAPCTEGTSHDWDSPWMARHRWFGHADRFRAQNVIDGFAGFALVTEPAPALHLGLGVTNHVFAFAQPGGRWHDTDGTLVGIDLDNRNPWAANELDVQATLHRGWLRLDLGWLLVANLGGGRALSGEALRQFVYVMITVDAWTPWR